MPFFFVKSAAEARRLLQWGKHVSRARELPVSDAAGAVLAQNLVSPLDLPEFPRAVVDGFAVVAADTFGASAGLPCYLKVEGEVLMGREAPGPLFPGHAVRIATGGMVPAGADAVAMVEYTELTATGLVEIFRPCAPGEGLVLPGDDLRRGAPLLPGGRRLRPQDLGLLAGVGIVSVPCFAPPRVAVIPTGDEIVPPDQEPAPGQVRDINTTAIAAAVLEAHGEPITFPIVPDDPEALRATVEQALAGTDLVLLAGGSSVGSRDWTLEVLTSLPGAELLFHGVSIRPGKPVVAVGVGEKLMIGLPGNPVSALVVFQQFIRPVLRRLSGERDALPRGSRVRAVLTRGYASDAGKEDYVRVRLRETPAGYAAEPLLGKSTLLTTLVEADGLVVVPEHVEGLEPGTEAEVEIL